MRLCCVLVTSPHSPTVCVSCISHTHYCATHSEAWLLTARMACQKLVQTDVALCKCLMNTHTCMLGQQESVRQDPRPFPGNAALLKRSGYPLHPHSTPSSSFTPSFHRCAHTHFSVHLWSRAVEAMAEPAKIVKSSAFWWLRSLIARASLCGSLGIVHRG